MIHAFLLVGQSNMAGRGLPHEVEPIDNQDIVVLRNGRWWPMYVPVNPDRVTAGINLAESFAARYAREHGVKVGLIPCADGGTSLDQWKPGGVLFDHACMTAQLADRTAHIVGILWHQGESDCGEARYPLVKEKLKGIIGAFRQVPCLEKVPFLVGGLGDYLQNYGHHKHISENYWRVNEGMRAAVAETENCGFVEATGLGANPDNLHFSAAALREFGQRYYEVFLGLEDKQRTFEEKPSWEFAVRGELEAL